jgi:hypothetical protein
MRRDIGGDEAATQQAHTRVYTNDTGLQSVCAMDSSDEDVMMLTVAAVNNAVKRRCKREHWVHPYIAERVLTYGTFAASRDLSMYPNKFKEMYRMSKESFHELCEYVGPFIAKKDTNYRNAIPIQERLLIFIR